MHPIYSILNPLSPNPTKWSTTLKQFTISEALSLEVELASIQPLVDQTLENISHFNTLSCYQATSSQCFPSIPPENIRKQSY